MATRPDPGGPTSSVTHMSKAEIWIYLAKNVTMHYSLRVSRGKILGSACSVCQPRTPRRTGPTLLIMCMCQHILGLDKYIAGPPLYPIHFLFGTTFMPDQ